MAVKVDGLEIAVKSTVTGLNSFKSLQATISKLATAVEKLNGQMPRLSGSMRKTAAASPKTAQELKKVNKECEKLNRRAAKTAQSTKKLGDTTKESGGIFAAVGKRMGSFFKSIGRIAVYRAIRSALKAVAGAFKEGVENVYLWSQAGGDMGKFAKSMDTIATAILYVKNALGALVSPLIDTLAPAIDSLADRFVVLLNIVNEGMARLTGASGWRKAIKYPIQFKEATTEATQAVKDFTMGWDELNVINDSNGGRGADALDYGKMFEWVTTDFAEGETEGWWTKFENALDTWKTKWDEWGLGDTLKKFAEEYLPTILNYIGSALAYVLEIVGALTIPALKATLDLIMSILDFFSGNGDQLGNLLRITLNGANTIFAPIVSLIDTISGWFGADWNLSEKWNEAVEGLNKALKEGDWEGIGKTLKAGFGVIWTPIEKWFSDRKEETVKFWKRLWNFSLGDIIDLIMGRASHTSTKASIDKNESKITDFWKQLVAKLKEKYTVAFAAGETGLSFGGWIAKQIITGILNGLIQRIKETVGKWMTPWVTFKTEFKKSWTASGQDEDIAKKVDESIFDKIVSWWKTSPVGRLATAITDAFKAAAEKLPDWVKRLLGIQIPQKTIGVGGGGASGGPVTITYYANGGTPNTGSLFWAGEAGPELVDQVGGRSTVYNAGQLAQELSVANGNVVGAIYGMRDAVCGAIAAKDTTVRISGGDIGRANAEYQRKRGVYVNTGAFANAY